MTKLFLLFIVICATGFFCCGESSEDKTDLPPSETATEPFVVPDSIDTSLLIAMFDELNQSAHTLLIYNDSTKQSAKKIQYTGKHVLTEDLSFVAYHELRSDAKNTTYLVKDKSVTAIAGVRDGGASFNTSVSGNPVISEYKRTDTHLSEYQVVIEPH